MPLHTPTRSRKPARSAREAILEAAGQIFAAKGLEGARTDAIAREARVNKALLYYYFKSKNALFNAVVEDTVRESNQRLMDILCSPGSEKKILLRYVGAVFDFLSSRPEAFGLFQRFLMTNPAVAGRIMKGYFLPRMDKLAALIRSGVQHGAFRRVDPVQAAHSVHALVFFYFRTGPLLKEITGWDPFDTRTLKKRRSEMLDFIRYGLFREPEARNK